MLTRLFILSLLVYSTATLAEDKEKSKTKLVLGAGIATTHIQDYIGSDEGRTYVLPVPFIYYKSDRITLDRNAFQGELFENKKWHLTLDASGSIPVDSDENEARKGMPDLDWVGELGPSLEYYLAGKADSQNKIYFDFSIRKAIASDFRSVDDVGWTSEFAIKRRILWPTQVQDGEVTVSTSFGIRGVTAKYADYYYGVEETYSNDHRRVFEGRSGYGGVKAALGVTWRKKNLWVGAFTRYTNIENSVFEESSLVKSNNNLLAGFVVSYIFMDR